MKKQKFYVCEVCGNLIGLIHDSGVPMECCGQAMTELVPNTVEASTEKHIPVIHMDGNHVSVEIGSIAHPMEDKHYIEWIYLETVHGGQRKALKPGDSPSASFILQDDEAVAVYAYCNIHGLWKKEV
ncbi:MAG: desulfoferrodoxin family protein [Lachnospiraceae bacterium]